MQNSWKQRQRRNTRRDRFAKAAFEPPFLVQPGLTRLTQPTMHVFQGVPCPASDRHHCCELYRHPEGKDYSVDTIRGWHKALGSSDIGYHYIVHLDDKVSVGRQIEKAGAHVAGHNATSIGVSYVGGVTVDGKTPRTPRQRRRRPRCASSCQTSSDSFRASVSSKVTATSVRTPTATATSFSVNGSRYACASMRCRNIPISSGDHLAERLRLWFRHAAILPRSVRASADIAADTSAKVGWMPCLDSLPTQPTV